MWSNMYVYSMVFMDIFDVWWDLFEICYNLKKKLN